MWRTLRLSRQLSNPATHAWPDVGRNRPSSSLSVVVFPEPLGPSRPKTSPRRISRHNESSAYPAVQFGQLLSHDQPTFVHLIRSFESFLLQYSYA